MRCRIGQEKETVLHLLRKAITYQSTDEPLLIKSVVCPEGAKGYIYVEAFKESHVKTAIDGMANLRLGLYDSKMVAIKEMAQVLRVVKSNFFIIIFIIIIYII